jgi:hypothetical protein
MYKYTPNVVVEWFTRLLRIREVPGLNLGPETDYPVWSFSLFSSVPPGECRSSTLKSGHDRFLPYPFQFIINLSTIYIVLVTEM